MEQFISLPQASQTLKVPYGVLLSLASEGKIPSYRPGRKYFVNLSAVKVALANLTSQELVESFIEDNHQVENMETKDIYLAAALLCLGLEMTTLDLRNGMYFFNIAGDDLDQKKEDYFNKNIQVDAYEFVQNLKYIKSKMYSMQQ